MFFQRHLDVEQLLIILTQFSISGNVEQHIKRRRRCLFTREIRLEGMVERVLATNLFTSLVWGQSKFRSINHTRGMIGTLLTMTWHSLSYYVTLGKSFNLSVPQRSPL